MKMSELKVSLLNRRLFCGIVLIFAAVLVAAHPYRAFLNESGGSVEGPAWMAVFIYGVSSERTLLFLIRSLVLMEDGYGRILAEIPVDDIRGKLPIIALRWLVRRSMGKDE